MPSMIAVPRLRSHWPGLEAMSRTSAANVPRAAIAAFARSIAARTTALAALIAAWIPRRSRLSPALSARPTAWTDAADGVRDRGRDPVDRRSTAAGPLSIRLEALAQRREAGYEAVGDRERRARDGLIVSRDERDGAVDHRVRELRALLTTLVTVWRTRLKTLVTARGRGRRARWPWT